VADLILSKPRAKEFEAWEQPQPTLKELRARLGRNLSDEELLLRVLFSREEVDAMQAAGPVPTDPRTSSSAVVENLRELVQEASSARAISVTRPGLSVSLRRNGPA
jgi:oxaloacetate decarboxylase alpha subunit